MIQIKNFKLFIPMVYTNVLTLNPRYSVLSVKPLSYTLEVAGYCKLGSTGRFFKKLAFIGLAYSCLKNNSFKTVTLKSTLVVLWNMLATYTVIF